MTAAITAATDQRSTTTEAASSSNSTLLMRRLLLSLSLSLSPASKVIAKQHGGAAHHHHQQHHHHLAGGSGGAFRCKTCGRAFATFQALGGHRTSHNRPLVRAHGLDLLLGARPGKGGAAAGDVHHHRCGSCGAVFPTGQALGGHMRRHRAAVAAAAFGDGAAAVDVHGESSTTVVHGMLSSREHDQGEKEDDGMREIRLIKFI